MFSRSCKLCLKLQTLCQYVPEGGSSSSTGVEAVCGGVTTTGGAGGVGGELVAHPAVISTRSSQGAVLDRKGLGTGTLALLFATVEFLLRGAVAFVRFTGAALGVGATLVGFRPRIGKVRLCGLHRQLRDVQAPGLDAQQRKQRRQDDAGNPAGDALGHSSGVDLLVRT